MMDEVLHANIFFVIASVATVLFCIFVCLILYHVLKIVRSIRSIVERVDASSEQIAADYANMREAVVSGSVIMRVAQFFMGGTSGRGRGKRRSRTED